MKTNLKILFLIVGLLAAPIVSAIDLNINCAPASANPSGLVSCTLDLSSTPTTISEYGFHIDPLTYFTVTSVGGYPTGYTGDYSSTTNNVGVITGDSTTATRLATITLTAGSNPGSEQLTVSAFSMSDYNFAPITVTVLPSNSITAAAPTCTESWSCTAWSACSSSGTQTRTCTDGNNCGTTATKPAESQACTPAPPAPVCGDADDVCASGATQACTTAAGYSGTQSCLSDCTGWGSCSSTQSCGDGTKNGNEQCDGSDVGTASCATQGFTGGTLSCTSSCLFDTSLCTTTTTTQTVGQQVDAVFDNEGISKTAPIAGSWTTKLISRLAALFRSLFGG